MSFWSRSKKIPSQPNQRADKPNKILLDNSKKIRYCRRNLKEYALSSSSKIVFSQDITPTVIDNPDAALLLCCDKFETLDIHIQEYTTLNKRMGLEIDKEYVKEQLDQLIQKNLLISENEFLERFSHENLTNIESQISTIGILTKNRSESLEKCLGSILANAKTYKAESKNLRFLIVDDSTESRFIEQNRSILTKLQNDYNFNIEYLGFEEKRVWCQALSKRAIIPYEVLEFAILNPFHWSRSTGANRNSLLLETINEHILSLDDDIVCWTTDGDATNEVAICANDHFFETWFYKDHPSVFADALSRSIDIIGYHEELLGKSPAAHIKRINDTQITANIDEADADLIEKLSNQNATTAVTLNGVIGDAGINSTAPYFLLPPKIRERLVRTEEEYRAYLGSYEVKKMVRSKVITNTPWSFQTYTIGFDNRKLLPPFFPLDYGQDTLFGIVLKECFSTYLIGHLPFAILHEPPEKKVITSNHLEAISLANLISSCINLFSPNLRHLDGDEKLKALGKCLMDLGKYDSNKFQYLVHSSVLQGQGIFLEALETCLRYFRESPDFWAADLEEYLEKMKSFLINPDYIIPENIRTNRTPDEAKALLQEIVYRYGQLLFYWSDILSAAKQLKDEGFSPTQKSNTLSVT